MSLPRYPNATQQTATFARSGGRPYKANIVVMDDDVCARELYKINLQKLGHNVYLTTSGDQTLALYRRAQTESNPIDLVILDLNMHEGLSGSDTATAIRSMDRYAKLVISSGDNDCDEMKDFRKYGFDAALKKSFDRNEIAQVISNLLGAESRSRATSHPLRS